MNTRLAQSFALITLSVSFFGCGKLKGMATKDSSEGGVTITTSTSSKSGLAILNGFEGEIGVTVTSKDKPNKPVHLTLDVKGDKIRADAPQDFDGMEKLGKAYGIWDSPAKKIYVVLDQQKQVIVIDLDKTGEQLKGFKGMPGKHGPPGAPEPAKPPPKITKTGKTDTVAGYTCEIWEIENTDPADKEKAQLCVAEQGTSWFHIPMTGIPAEYAAMSEIVDGKHFPLRMIGYDAAGAEKGRVEVTKIDKKTLDASMFVPPAAYPQMDLGQMFGGMMGGGMGAGGMPHGGLPQRPMPTSR